MNGLIYAYINKANWKKARAEGRHGNGCSEETRKKISETQTGRVLSEETCARMSASKKGIHHSESAIENMRLARKNNKKVYIVENDYVCFSVHEAAIKLGCCRTSVTNALKSHKLVNGFHIEWYSNNVSNI